MEFEVHVHVIHVPVDLDLRMALLVLLFSLPIAYYVDLINVHVENSYVYWPTVDSTGIYGTTILAAISA